ncbi:MAG: glycosyltransferase family 2 protein [bacterium]
MKISLCIALYNEFSNLKYAIDSTYDWVDELVVVDGGSTDGTLNWLQNRGPKIHIISVPNDPIMFHRMKQKALDEAHGEWILQLDADEEVTQALQDEILHKIHDSKSQTLAYKISRKNFFLGRFLMKGGVYPDYTIRLYQRGSMYFPCKDVHENVEPVDNSVRKDSAWLGTLDNPLNHYSDPTWKRYFARWIRYCKAEASRLRRSSSAEQSMIQSFASTITRLAVLPIYTFLNTYIRHVGFLDGWQGFVFHGMSALRWWGTLYFTLFTTQKET